MTIISKSAKVVGSLSAKEKIVISGTVEGDVISDNMVQIEDGGIVKGNINCSIVVISGSIIGNIDSHKVHITKTGSVLGEVNSIELQVDKGAKLEGNSKTKQPLAVIVHDKTQEEITQNSDENKKISFGNIFKKAAKKR